MPLSVHTKIAIGWIAAISCGLYSFYLSKCYIEGHRYEAMKARERIGAVTEDVANLKRGRVNPKELKELDELLEKLTKEAEKLKNQ